ncbi:MAG: hypothetical protein H6550_14720 [Chitinophagales bacterium]|nr:hypothetical protein [Chitinophagales bacterium]
MSQVLNENQTLPIPVAIVKPEALKVTIVDSPERNNDCYCVEPFFIRECFPKNEKKSIPINVEAGEIRVVEYITTYQVKNIQAQIVTTIIPLVENGHNYVNFVVTVKNQVAVVANSSSEGEGHIYISGKRYFKK